MIHRRLPRLTSFYLAISEAVLAAARLAVKTGVAKSSILVSALKISNRLSRHAMSGLRASSRAGAVKSKNKLPRRGLRG